MKLSYIVRTGFSVSTIGFLINFKQTTACVV